MFRCKSFSSNKYILIAASGNISNNFFAFYIFATYKVNNLCYPAGIPVLKANILVGLTDFFYNFERLDIFFIIWGSADFIRNIILFI